MRQARKNRRRKIRVNFISRRAQSGCLHGRVSLLTSLATMKERLTPTFEAASKHTKPMLKSTVSPMRWLSMIQAYVLHCRAGGRVKC